MLRLPASIHTIAVRPITSQIMTPVVKLLRLMDGEKPAMGKVYDRMFMIGQKIE